MISTILIAVDGSAHSMKAVDYGAQIAAGIKAKIVLLYVAKQELVPDAMRQFAKVEHFSERDADILDVLKRGAKNMLDNAAGKITAAGVVEVETDIVEGPVARTIIARGKHHNADMIVLGSRGMGDLEGLLRGGVSHRVEILAKCPVLVVK